MANYSKIRYMYLRSNFRPEKHESFKFDRYEQPVQKHPHTCIAIRLDRDTNTIEYATARRESVGGLIWLKKRMALIQSLGGIVPASMHKELKNRRKDFTKKRARFVACRRLENSAHSIEGVDCSNVTAHEVSRLVMEAIVADESFVTFESFEDLDGISLPMVVKGETECARESAKAWLHMNVEARTMPFETGTAQELAYASHPDLLTEAAFTGSDLITKENLPLWKALDESMDDVG